MVDTSPPSLASVGFEAVPASSPGHAALMRAARRLQGTGWRSFGLLPADGTVVVSSLAVQLAIVLHQRMRIPVHVIDANPWRPALADVVAPAATTSTTDWLTRSFAEGAWVSSVRTDRAVRFDLQSLDQLIGSQASQGSIVLVALAGLEEHGVHLAVCELVDGVSVVARAGRTREWAIVRALAGLPPGKSLGVLLID